MKRLLFCGVLSSWALACTPSAVPDAGVAVSDAGPEPVDLGPEDLGPAPDAGPEDSGPAPDLGVMDSGPADLGTPDSGPIDMGSQIDAGTTGGCGLSPGANDRRWTLTHDALSREFLVHLPTGYDPNTPTPVVFDFHGRLFTANLQVGLTGMRDVADANGFIVVHPEGIGRTWNGGVCCGEASTSDVDDVGFTAAMIDALQAELCVDSRRVYATGMSNGGFMSHRLACELSDRITAIAPVAGVLGITGCSPTRPVPVLHYHGTDDNIVGYNGIRGYLSVADSMEGWVMRNGCGVQSTVTFVQDDVECETWPGCQGSAEVQLCTINGGGHTWPGGTPIPGLGRTSNTVDASADMWTFFQRFSLP